MNLWRTVVKFWESLRVSGPLWTASAALDQAGVRMRGFWSDVAIPVETLSAQVAGIFRAWGMPEEQIVVAVGHVLYSDIHGIDSHGCGMMRQYHRGLLDGTLAIAPKIEIVRESDTTALIDGGGGLGHVPSDLAMKLVITKSRAVGTAAVTVRNSGHFGAAGSYAALAAQAGLIGMAVTNTEKPAVVPTFGVEPMFGTNPLAFAAPASRNRPFLLDMATSTVPLGRIVTAWRKGRAIPEGWALDDKGAPLTDARSAFEGRRLTPLGGSRELGGHKGYGLGAMVEILSSVLPGCGAKRNADEAGGPTGHFFMALDPGRFRNEGEFGKDLDELLDGWRASKPVDPEQPVLVAGDPEYAAREARLRSGIPLSRSIVEDLRLICRASNTPFIIAVNNQSDEKHEGTPE